MKFLGKQSVVAALLILMISIFFAGCAASAPQEAEKSAGQPELTVSFTFAKVDSHGTNQFAVWIEDEAGEYVATVAATKFTAKGGYEKRPDAIPVWVSKSGLADMTKQEIDAVSSATPKSGEVSYTWDCTYADGSPVAPGIYRVVVEGTSDYSDNIGRSVLFAGAIELGGESTEVSAVLEQADEYAAERGMITDVMASYMPAK